MLIEIHPQNPDLRKLKIAADILNAGGIIIYPTDSVYAAGCLLNQSRALEQLAKFKKIKPQKANFSIICYDLSDISEYARNIENNIFKIMKKALPGPYTFILNASSKIPSYFNANKKTIGIRVPNCEILRELVRLCEVPLVSTSLHDDEDNYLEYHTDAELIHEKYGEQVELVINGGIGNIEPTTIIDCTTGIPELIREGKGEVSHLF